jgi:hypothetical protein
MYMILFVWIGSPGKLGRFLNNGWSCRNAHANLRACIYCCFQGRIDKKFMLGYMNSPEIVQMLEHYFQTKLTDEQCERIELAIAARESKPRLDLTPAQVEQLTAEHEQVDEMIEALENKSRPALPRPTLHSLLERSDGSTVISMRGISIKYDGA